MKLKQWTVFIDMLGFRDINESITSEEQAKGKTERYPLIKAINSGFSNQLLSDVEKRVYKLSQYVYQIGKVPHNQNHRKE